MRDLYEVLNIEADADESQLKIAYRKAALRWHPDKNQDNLKEAEERFKEIQNAYEVLNDKHERAWYDSHKDDILRGGGRHQAGGGGGAAAGQAPADDINLYPYFSSTCYNGYRDGPAGFYGVYEDLFSRLARQEADAQRGTEIEDLPVSFGTSTTEWPQVASFYRYWTKFVTSKSFAWADKYNPASAPNRKVRRLMEEENKSARKAERSKYIDTVRELAMFLQKRDKRVAAHKAEEGRRQAEKEEAEKLRKEEERAERRRRAREYEEAAWAEEGSEGGSEEEAADNIPDELYCLACDKSFRTPNAFANHEKSKKHLEKVALLREVMAEEEELANLQEDLLPSTSASSPMDAGQPALPPSDPESGPEAPARSAKPRLSKKEKKRQQAAAQFRRGHSQFAEAGGGDSDGASHLEDGADSEESAHSDAGAREEGGAADGSVSEEASSTREGDDEEGSQEDRSDGASDREEASSEAEEGNGTGDDSLEALLNIQRSKRKAGPREGPPSPGGVQEDSEEGSSSEEADGDTGDESLEALLKLQKGRRKPEATNGSRGPGGVSEAAAEQDSLEDVDEIVGKLDIGEESQGEEESMKAPKKGRRRKKGAAATVPVPQEAPPPQEKGSRKKGKGRQKELEGSATQCSICSADFSSRTKLFQHIKSTGHAAPKL